MDIAPKNMSRAVLETTLWSLPDPARTSHVRGQKWCQNVCQKLCLKQPCGLRPTRFAYLARTKETPKSKAKAVLEETLWRPPDPARISYAEKTGAKKHVKSCAWSDLAVSARPGSHILHG